MLYVVTNPDLGWDSVIGVYSDKEYVKSKFGNEPYVISDFLLDNSKMKKTNKKFGNYKEIADGVGIEKDLFIVMDTFEVDNDDFDSINSKESMSYIGDLFKEFCKDNGYDCGNIYLSKSGNNEGRYSNRYSVFCDGLSGDYSGISGDVDEKWCSYLDKLDIIKDQ